MGKTWDEGPGCEEREQVLRISEIQPQTAFQHLTDGKLDWKEGGRRRSGPLLTSIKARTFYLFICHILHGALA